MMLIKETAGDTLTGAIDGTNATFVVSFDYDISLVNVFWNGILKVASLDDGYTLTTPRTVVLKEAPQVGDTIEIEYNYNNRTGGGALGGIPEPPVVEELIPETASTIHELKPEIFNTQKEPCED